jgi:hypothetical protein
VELNYARRLYALWEGHLWAEASYMVGASRDEIFGQELESRALLQSATLGARYTYQLMAWVVPFARAGLGVGIGTLELEGDGVAGAVEDTAASFCGYLLVGVEVLLPLRRFRETGHGFTLGLVVEGGVAFASGLSFELGPEEDDELLQIPFESSSLGRINTSGGQVRVGLVARF